MMQGKLTLFPHCLHLAKIHHPQRTPQTSNSERCPWASMNLSSPLRNEPELGLCLVLGQSEDTVPAVPVA